MLRLLIQFLTPLALAAVLTVAHARGGAARLCQVTALGVLLLGTVALLHPHVTYHYRAPLDANGVIIWPWLPLTVVAIAIVVWVLARVRVPMFGRVVAGTLVGMVTTGLRLWMS